MMAAPGFHVHRSNRTEALVDALADLVRRPAGDPMSPECVVVQGRGMERWVAMRLSRRLGVWANAEFVFPGRLMARVLDALLGPAEASRAFEPETLMWTLAAELPGRLDQGVFAPVAAYLERDRGGVKLVQLCERIANTFDHYVTYRPQMVLDWERGGGEGWQPELWRAACRRHGSVHLAARAAGVPAALVAAAGAPEGIPARVVLFGISTLPPLYVSLLDALSRLVEVHLFVLSPSREYWAHIRSSRETMRDPAHRSLLAEDREALHIEAGNPLLASMGRLGRDFQEVLESVADYEEDVEPLYREPGHATMLATLQSDILDLKTRGDASGAEPRRPIAAGDQSLAFHACHSPMREVEVLHDQLLALFEENPQLGPEDVIVMTPAIEEYAPFVDAVFGQARDDGDARPRIPYRLADRSLRRTDETAAALLAVLGVLRGRMSAEEVLDLLAHEPIRRRFAIAADDVERVRRWVSEAGIRWAVDASHRAEVGQPAFGDFTWRFGLDRLLLGCAMTGDGARLFGGVLGYDDMEGSGTGLLGLVADFCATLFRLRELPGTARSWGEWRGALTDLIDAMVAPADRQQRSELLGCIGVVAERAALAGLEAKVHFDVLYGSVERELQARRGGRGFLSGGVTFCELVPMRSIPFPVVCLIGMNDGAFPRSRRPLGFDLIARQPMIGDRSSRDDDRYLFLEALLSARQRLVVTYVGCSIRDNSDIPPSVVVSELLDAAEDAFELPGDASSEEGGDGASAVRRRLVVRHPLQAFSPEYFRGDPRRPGFSRHDCEAARALQAPARAPGAFVTGPLGPPGTVGSEVSLDDLVRFFQHPLRHFAQRRCEVFLDGRSERLADREPMDLDPLERWRAGDALLERLAAGADRAQAFAAIRAAGLLPIGAPGECQFAELAAAAEPIAAAAAALREGRRLDDLRVDAALDGTRICGVVRGLWPGGRVCCAYSKPGGAREIDAWIRHLVLNWCAPPGYPRETFLVGRGEEGSVQRVRFAPVDDAADLLRLLLDLHRRGLNAPLLLLPKTSRAFAEAAANGDAERAADRARSEFETRPHGGAPGEGEDPYVRQILGGAVSLDALIEGGNLPVADGPSFRDAAVAFFGPLLEHRGKAA